MDLGEGATPGGSPALGDGEDEGDAVNKSARDLRPRVVVVGELGSKSCLSGSIVADELALERARLLDVFEMVALLSDARGITLGPVCVCALLAGDGDAV